MVISLNEVADEPLLSRALILIVVAFAITAGVYGAVALIVKMDDVGPHLAQAREGCGRVVRARAGARDAGRPVGALEGRIAAMLWVGGRILLVGLDGLGLHGPYDTVHHAEEGVDDALGAAGGVGAWLTDAAPPRCSGWSSARSRWR